MSSNRITRGLALAGLIATTTAASADVEVWAPGMTSTRKLTSTARYQEVALGKPYRYDIWGVSGNITLGDTANGATAVAGTFKANNLLGFPTNTTVNSTAFVELQTGLLNFYPETISVVNSKPGTSSGALSKYGANWTLADPKSPTSVNLTFHSAASNLITALLPGLLSPSYYNINPSGYFYVMGQYHAGPPVMTGTLTTPSDSIMVGTKTTVNFTINRYEVPVYRPPLLGLDLGAANVSLLGSPAASSPGNSVATAPVYTTSTELVVVGLNLSSGTSGNGWTKISLGL